jgi:hypothetical protein
MGTAPQDPRRVRSAFAAWPNTLSIAAFTIVAIVPGGSLDNAGTVDW